MIQQMHKRKEINPVDKKRTAWSDGYWFVRKQYLILLTILTVFAAYLVWDYRGPLEIPLQPDNACGLPAMRAKDLLVQGHDTEGNLWATRGMVAYRLAKGDNKFIRQYHVPTGFSIFWLRNFSIVRRLTLRPEAIELLPMPEGEACAMSAGHMWYRPPNGKDFKETLTLPHYGISTGQGVRNDGLIRLKDGTILLGEYFLNKDRTNVRIFSSKDNGKTWQVVYDFQPGQIMHIHSIQQDPYTGKIWVCTGDLDKESMVLWSNDGAKTLNPIGQGSQIWRVTQLVFTKDALFWGTDTLDNNVSGIYRWDRTTHKLTKLADVAKEMFYATRLAGGTIIMSTTSTVTGGYFIENDETGLRIITEEKNITPLMCGTRGSERKYAKLRFQRDQDAASLYITFLNHNEYNDGDLIVIPEEELRSVAESSFAAAVIPANTDTPENITR